MVLIGSTKIQISIRTLELARTKDIINCDWSSDTPKLGMTYNRNTRFC